MGTRRSLVRPNYMIQSIAIDSTRPVDPALGARPGARLTYSSRDLSLLCICIKLIIAILYNLVLYKYNIAG